MVSPSTCTDVINIVNVRFRKVLYFEKPLKVLSPEHSQIIKLLVGNEFDFLFDLGDPANISIPYLANISQRVCIGTRSLLPYYNIIFENADALIDYFNLKPPSSSKLFNFSKSKIKETNKKYNLNTTYIVVNSKRDIKSDHHKFTIGKDIDIENPDIYAIILSSHGYFGEKDHFAEFARLNNITIID